MSKTQVYPIDLRFQGIPHAIASYLIPYENGGVLIESGPGSTIESLKSGLSDHGFAPEQITDLLLTHIHLDHAGAAGWLARKGVRVHVHHVGAPHLLSPKRLLSSATRIYGDKMDVLWGDFLPVPNEKLAIHSDGDIIEVGGLRFLAIDTPGHATHHFAYLMEDICFSGDIGGVRLPSANHVRLPMPPPEFHLEDWRKSLARLRKAEFSFIAPTHFGIFPDPYSHLNMLEKALDEIDSWIDAEMPANPSIEILQTKLTKWAEKESESNGLSRDLWKSYELVNPTWMSASGIYRYWHKIRNPTS